MNSASQQNLLAGCKLELLSQSPPAGLKGKESQELLIELDSDEEHQVFSAVKSKLAKYHPSKSYGNLLLKLQFQDQQTNNMFKEQRSNISKDDMVFCITQPDAESEQDDPTDLAYEKCINLMESDSGTVNNLKTKSEVSVYKPTTHEAAAPQTFYSLSFNASQHFQVAGATVSHDATSNDETPKAREPSRSFWRDPASFFGLSHQSNAAADQQNQVPFLTTKQQTVDIEANNNAPHQQHNSTSAFYWAQFRKRQKLISDQQYYNNGNGCDDSYTKATPFFSADQMSNSSAIDRVTGSRHCSVVRILITLVIVCAFGFIIQMLIKNGLQLEQEIKLEDALTEYKGCKEVAALEQSSVRMLNKNGQAVYFECSDKANETTNN